jgi:hypothetical protein
MLVLIGLGVNEEFQQRAEAALRRVVPNGLYSGGPVKGFPRM